MEKPRLEDDFDNYVNYEWKKDNEIPAEYPRYSNFTKMSIDLEDLKEKMCESNMDPLLNKVYNLFKNQNEEETKKYIMNKINKIKETKNKLELIDYLLKEVTNGNYLLFHMCFGGTERNPQFQIPEIGFYGLSLSDKVYYTEKTQYKDDVLKLIENQLKYFDLYEDDLSYIWEIEKDIAESHYSNAEKRIPLKTYHPMTIDAFCEVFEPYFDNLKDYFPSEIYDITVNNSELLKKFKKIYDENSLERLQTWFIWKTIKKYTSNLSNENILYKNSFDFYSKKLNGIEKPKDMKKRGANFTEDIIPDIFSKIYLEKYCDPKLKTEFPKFVEIIRSSLIKKIEKAKWITEDNRETTLEKLRSMTLKVVSQDNFESYEKLDKEYTNILEFVDTYYKWDWDVNECEKKMYKLRDPKTWEMSAMTVNAYYHPLYNEIVFPAGILQEPFYSVKNSFGENAGGIGAVISHEMTHGFDDQGSNYDKNGYLYSWWSKETKENYETIIKKMETYFDKLIHVDMQINAKLTQGENLADLGGLQTALSSCPNEEEQKKCIYTWAKIWRANVRYEYAQQMIELDPHSPPHLRINGILPHIELFYKLFNIKESDKLYLKEEERCNLWSE